MLKDDTLRTLFAEEVNRIPVPEFPSLQDIADSPGKPASRHYSLPLKIAASAVILLTCFMGMNYYPVNPIDSKFYHLVSRPDFGASVRMNIEKAGLALFNSFHGGEKNED